MSTISIGGDKRLLADADQQWVIQEIQERRKDNQTVCVVVHIQTEDLNMTLCTPSCARGGGGGRAPTPREQAIFTLWKELGLDELNFSPGSLVAFLQRLRRLL